MSEWSDWAIPAVTLTGAFFWLLVLIRGLRRISSRRLPSVTTRVGTLATITLVAWCMVISSLIYPDVINVETSRLFLTISRLCILLGGIWVWWSGRRSWASRSDA